MLCSHSQSRLCCSDLVPLGQTRTKFNFNLDEKRVLNFENVVSDDDNIKQDMSIDVYGRQDKEETAEPTVSEKPAAADAKVRLLHVGCKGVHHICRSRHPVCFLYY